MVWRDWLVYSTPLGRPQVLHAFDKLRAGQSRGVSRFVAALKTFRAFKFTDATLEAATLNALFLGFVKSNAGLSPSPRASDRTT
jgi:capsid protein